MGTGTSLPWSLLARHQDPTDKSDKWALVPDSYTSCTHRRLTTPIVYVPSKGGQLHSEYHLGSGDINDLVTGISESAEDVVQRKIAHDNHEDYPRHPGGPDVIGH